MKVLVSFFCDYDSQRPGDSLSMQVASVLLMASIRIRNCCFGTAEYNRKQAETSAVDGFSVIEERGVLIYE